MFVGQIQHLTSTVPTLWLNLPTFPLRFDRKKLVPPRANVSRFPAGNGASSCRRCGFKPGGDHFSQPWRKLAYSGTGHFHIGDTPIHPIFPRKTHDYGRFRVRNKNPWWESFDDLDSISRCFPRWGYFFGALDSGSWNSRVRNREKPTQTNETRGTTSRQTIESSLRLLKAQLFWDFNFWNSQSPLVAHHFRFAIPLRGPPWSRLVDCAACQIATAILLDLPRITSFFKALIPSNSPDCFPHTMPWWPGQIWCRVLCAWKSWAWNSTKITQRQKSSGTVTATQQGKWQSVAQLIVHCGNPAPLLIGSR